MDDGGDAVDLATGALRVSIPLMELRAGQLSLPVTLDYTGGKGVRVADQDGLAGVGWRLSLANTESRTVRRVSLAYTDAPSGRRQLRSVRVTSDGRLLASRVTGYWPGADSESRDLFGLSNHAHGGVPPDTTDTGGIGGGGSTVIDTSTVFTTRLQAAATCTSILDDDGTIGARRAYRFTAARGLLLRRISTETGRVTTYAYAPDTMTCARVAVGFGCKVARIVAEATITGDDTLLLWIDAPFAMPSGIKPTSATCAWWRTRRDWPSRSTTTPPSAC